MLSLDDIVRLNQYAQSIMPLDQARAWFETLGGEERLAVLQQLAVLAQEARAVAGDIPEALQRSTVKKTATPWVLVMAGPLRAQIAKVVHLPAAEQPKSFLVLLSLFAVADARRRRDECAQGCKHWWHRDLSDAATVHEILADE